MTSLRHERVSRGSPAAFKVYVVRSVVLGRATIPIRHLLKRGRGAVIELDNTVEDTASIYEMWPMQ